MRSRLDEVPVLKTLRCRLEASQYNPLRLALLRLGSPLRVELPKLRHLDLVLIDDLWVCVDRMLSDLPIAAWSEFDRTSRHALDEPVPCTLRVYHVHAYAVIPLVFSEGERVLRKRMGRGRSGTGRRRR
jgi:hypothetical protein